MQACQNCKSDFVIEAEDFDFYEKMKVPAPTFCPECRLQRRLVWMKGLDLFKRKCDLCQVEKLSIYHPDAPYTVYCAKCWWSDKWDAKDYAVEYDANQSFLEQWNNLLHKVPLLGISIDAFSAENSPYTNHVGHSRNSYLIYYSDQTEECAYGFYLARAKYIYDCSPVIECENSYDSGNIFKCYNVVGTYNARHNIDSCFLSNCDNCTNCFGCANVKNGSYMFFNEQLSKEEYFNKLKEIDLGSCQQYKYWKEKAHEHWLKYPPKPNYDDFSVNSSGSYYFESQNCKECYEVQGCQDSKYLMIIKSHKVKDSYDYTDWGENAERIYECMTVGGDVGNVLFTHESGYSLNNAEYSKLVGHGCDNIFGSIGLKKSSYCILNKQYSKEEYEKLRSQIIEDMNKNPYVNKEGHVYKYGEFFPPEFSPHAYNDSFASRFFPLNKEEVEKKGLRWYEPEKREYSVTMQTVDIPDNIQSVPDSIIQEVIQCSNCARGFKVIPQELQFLKQHNLPLPRQCPFCRIWEKVDKWVLNMKLYDRTCMKCGLEFRTHYDKNQAPNILCKDCYKKDYIS